MKSILLLCVLCWTPGGGDGVLKGDMGNPWRDAVAYRMPDDPITKNRAIRAAEWLKSHLVSVPLPQDKFPIPVIAWKDPTLEPANLKILAGYVITDTLWSAKALIALRSCRIPGHRNGPSTPGMVRERATRCPVSSHRQDPAPSCRSGLCPRLLAGTIPHY